MGREIKRVPLDFDWPLGKTWKGYVNPHYRECPMAAMNECHGGTTSAGMWLDAISRFLNLVGEAAVEAPPTLTSSWPRGWTTLTHTLRTFLKPRGLRCRLR